MLARVRSWSWQSVTGEDRFAPAARTRLSRSASAPTAPDVLAEVPALVISAFDRLYADAPIHLLRFLHVPGRCRSRCRCARLRRAPRGPAPCSNSGTRTSGRVRRGSTAARSSFSSFSSLLQINSRCAYALIRDAWTAGAQRPLIIAGGAQATYEPVRLLVARERAGRAASPDVVVTGEGGRDARSASGARRAPPHE